MRHYHKNPRQITKKQVEQLNATLAELGDLSGVIHNLPTDEMIGGNQRGRVFDINQCEIELVEQYDEPDAQGTVAHGFVIWRGAKYAYRQVVWTPKQCEKANIVANKAGGTWDFDVLANEFDLGDLLDWGFEPVELGIDTTDPPEPGDAEPQVNRAEELREEWGVEPGQLWRLPSRTEGQEHRLICGDCTDAAVVDRVMGGERAALLATDPPYGVDFEGAKYNPRAKEWEGIAGDKRQGAILQEWLKDAITTWLPHCDRRAGFYFWAAAMDEGGAALAGIKEAGIHVQAQIIWAKNTLVLGQADYHWKHENCWYGFLKGEKHYWYGGRAQTTVWEVDKIANQSYTHPMQKPTELYEIPIRNHTLNGEVCLDPFVGSGTQLIAAENLARQCRAIEISPAYVAVALQRYQDAFGIAPELIDNLTV